MITCILQFTCLQQDQLTIAWGNLFNLGEREHSLDLAVILPLVKPPDQRKELCWIESEVLTRIYTLFAVEVVDGVWITRFDDLDPVEKPPGTKTFSVVSDAKRCEFQEIHGFNAKNVDLKRKGAGKQPKLTVII